MLRDDLELISSLQDKYPQLGKLRSSQVRAGDAFHRQGYCTGSDPESHVMNPKELLEVVEALCPECQGRAVHFFRAPSSQLARSLREVTAWIGEATRPLTLEDDVLKRFRDCWAMERYSAPSQMAFLTEEVKVSAQKARALLTQSLRGEIYPDLLRGLAKHYGRVSWNLPVRMVAPDVQFHIAKAAEKAQEGLTQALLKDDSWCLAYLPEMKEKIGLGALTSEPLELKALLEVGALKKGIYLLPSVAAIYLWSKDELSYVRAWGTYHNIGSTPPRADHLENFVALYEPSKSLKGSARKVFGPGYVSATAPSPYSDMGKAWEAATLI